MKEPAQPVGAARRIGPGPLLTPGSQRSTLSIPADILRQAAARLRTLALLYGVGYAIAFLIPLLTIEGWHRRETFRVELSCVAVSMLLALAIFVIVRFRRLEARSLVRLALAFEILAGAGISFTEQWGIFGGGPIRWFGISWIALWIVLFPLVVPAPPRMALAASFLTAATGPAANLFSVLMGRSPGLPIQTYLNLFYPSFLAVVIALFASRVIFGLGAKVRQAREMGSYRLTEKLGSGGMGEVWRAEHRMLARPAAIKLVRSDRLGHEIRAEVLGRFEREAQATAGLRSPHTVELYDYGITEDGILYYVMELLEGMDLDRLVRRFGSVPPERCVHVLRQVCRSLADAHEHGLIHRDVKPANIYLCRMGGEADFAKVLDFGLVRGRRDCFPSDPHLTVSGMITGTPAFLAPEIARGSAEIDGRADLYSLGCVAYWLLAGVLVFEADSPLEMAAHHLQSRPVPLSERAETPIPADLERLVMTCLEKDPAARPAGAPELEKALSACRLAGAWTRERAEAWWRAHVPQLGTSKPSPEGGGFLEIHSSATSLFLKDPRQLK